MSSRVMHKDVFQNAPQLFVHFYQQISDLAPANASIIGISLNSARGCSYNASMVWLESQKVVPDRVVPGMLLLILLFLSVGLVLWGGVKDIPFSFASRTDFQHAG